MLLIMRLKIIKRILYSQFGFSSFSICYFSVLFFETTEGTQLSLEGILNSGVIYQGMLKDTINFRLLESFITFDAYLKIFTTSFLGAIFFKILILIFIPALNELLLNLGLPVANDDFQNYLVEYVIE